MKAYKVEILIIDHDGLGADEITKTIENQKYPNWCMRPKVKKVTEADIGPWDDEHPLNLKSKSTAEYNRIFEEK